MKKQVQENVLVRLTNDEMRDRAQSLASKLNEIDDLTMKHAEIKKQLKLKADNAHEEERELRAIIATGMEQRPVDCEETFDFKKGVVVTRRIDSGAEVGTRKMTDEERQLQIGGMAGTLANETPAAGGRKKPRGAANPNGKDLEAGEGVEAPPDGLDGA